MSMRSDLNRCNSEQEEKRVIDDALQGVYRNNGFCVDDIYALINESSVWYVVTEDEEIVLREDYYA
jgi:hypothetical protein